ncbi:hypothetical protein [Flavobacterium suncheonense]|uniref:Lipoprotein n=1 Tax=Flavobacterium suncheonense GH29-5 = DSM 17707 TaxID=1121899 RepID=A0A0A2MBP6_9FLAO|nr:hypothetical protein [Flavobacterium suncheonense]KGO89071.1 hypothetical protein Q764_09785 [Flavobacterium suncheonense GH29-5 = DSM 17707]
MKNKFLIVLFAAVATLTSCKNEKEVSKEENKDVKKYFNVEIEASAAKSDNFAMYFSEDGTTNFKDINAVWAGIKGGPEFQKVTFNLSEEKMPTHIRLDFGLNNDQDSVVIKNVKVDYFGKDFQFKGSEFFKYFIEDKQFNTKIDAAKGTVTILKKDGVYKTPYYYPAQGSIDGIIKITSTKK